MRQLTGRLDVAADSVHDRDRTAAAAEAAAAGLTDEAPLRAAVAAVVADAQSVDPVPARTGGRDAAVVGDVHAAAVARMSAGAASRRGKAGTAVARGAAAAVREDPVLVGAGAGDLNAGRVRDVHGAACPSVAAVASVPERQVRIAAVPALAADAADLETDLVGGRDVEAGRVAHRRARIAAAAGVRRHHERSVPAVAAAAARAHHSHTGRLRHGHRRCHRAGCAAREELALVGGERHLGGERRGRPAGRVRVDLRRVARGVRAEDLETERRVVVVVNELADALDHEHVAVGGLYERGGACRRRSRRIDDQRADGRRRAGCGIGHGVADVRRR